MLFYVLQLLFDGRLVSPDQFRITGFVQIYRSHLV